MKTSTDFIVCRCEEVTYQSIVETIKKYKCSSRELKLRTRAGMGFCGGRTCRYFIDRIVADYGENAVTHNMPLKYQAPVRPVTFGLLGDLK
ncbi:MULTISPECIES: (2Fe-2S)-binding protein [Aneurinibacillus]|uniref:(2Fe-2S)-binding protein n=1 Tax=Aneurinibacillus thermoaerophilus TaxID=143495 RepID=A0A1G8BLP2_ANETH|nr:MULTISPECIES: (2Fe-2S)-binding protein [Aneurinibacillus]AMA73391.1 pyridine nucleotide-disulfide oxidoreductase [Aneurinibacillus sp. XH2]MED0676053.1 (2Fe-2S)-binding protein [Aneurinibacillus thermoaerophilus]MED0681111.1 (2Fe-2S)-binding protein [Aneurinibacillus thermoaerophilus]MED0736336.1 (2Fe-2S)-binding protein [Aneurinibacillus thermoaerophilus]MED0758446.1 (2Fe-2S)-binding protein [Aneurinibacillus thermoaerophilus]